MDIVRTKPSHRRSSRLVLIAALLLAGTGAAGAFWLKPKAPVVERASIWTGRVQRGPMVVHIKGTGALVPEQVRWVTSESSGRVEKLFLKPGSTVTTDQPLVQLENSDMRLQSLLAERDAATANAELIKLQHDVRLSALAEQASGATIDSERNDVQRRADTYADHGELFAQLDIKQFADRAHELQRRSDLASERIEQLRVGGARQIAAQKTKIARVGEVSSFRAQQLAALTVRAGSSGLLQDVKVELGQWVVPGTVLAKVVVSSQLKAELRVAEMQAKDLRVGQRASVDTHIGVVRARVARIAPAASEGTVKVELALEGDLPAGARPDLSVDGQIEVEHLDDVLSVQRPVGVQAGAEAMLFRVDPKSGVARRTTVRIGRASTDAVQIQSGLSDGDEVVLSDLSRWSGFDSIVIK